jgi:hypothetical protein
MLCDGNAKLRAIVAEISNHLIFGKGGLTCYTMMHFGLSILSTDRAPHSELVISNMDALQQEVCQAAIFEDCNCLYLHCIDTKFPLTIKIPGLHFLSIRGFFSHISFLNSQAVRRICILPKQKLEGVNSPCVITVTSSTEFKVRLICLRKHQNLFNMH